MKMLNKEDAEQKEELVQKYRDAVKHYDVDKASEIANELWFSYGVDINGSRTKKKKSSKPAINPSDDNFGFILNCAVRYAVGRRSYAPSTVIRFVTPLLPELNDRTLHCLDQDIADAKYEGGYGDKCDETDWMRFHEVVKAEKAKRGLKPYVNWRELER